MSIEKITKSDIFLERLKTARRQRSKVEFARFLSVSPQNYQRYEDGRIPDAGILDRIASKCNVSVDWLLGRDAGTVVAGMAEPDQAKCIDDMKDEGAKQEARFQRQIDFRFEQIRKLPQYRQKLHDEIISWLDKYMEWCAANDENEKAVSAELERRKAGESSGISDVAFDDEHGRIDATG